MPPNQIAAVRTIALVARDLGEDENLLAELTIGMEPHDGLIWIFGTGDDDQLMALSDEGVEQLSELIRLHRTMMK